MFQIIDVTSETILLETMETLKEINKYRYKLMWIAQKIEYQNEFNLQFKNFSRQLKARD